MKNAGYDVTVIDCQAEEINHEECARRVAEINPDVVGLTAMTFTLVDCKLTIEAIRRHIDTNIVVGGPHTAIFPMETFEGLKADYVIVGEGEKTMDLLCKDIASGKVNKFMDETKRVYHQHDYYEDLDDLPFAAREMTNIGKYYSILSEETPSTTFMSSRGCPFSCSYCDRPALGVTIDENGNERGGKRFRPQGAMRVVDEMEHCERVLGIKDIFFYDDTFSVSMKRVQQICDEYKKRKLTIKWDVRTRVNVINEELLKSMSEAGCTRIHFGVESGSPRVVREINKGVSLKQVEDAFRLCKKYKIRTLAYFMMGNPTETFEDVKMTLALSKRIKPDYMQMTILSPFPATEAYMLARQEGTIKGDPWREYSRKINDDFRPPLYDAIYTRQELESMLRWFYRKFYLHPKFILDRVLEIRNWGQFKRYWSAGISLLKMTVVPESKMQDSWKLRTQRKTANTAQPESAVVLK